MTVAMVTPPSSSEILNLLSVADMKLSLRISHSVEDAYIQNCILAAYDWLAGEHGWLNRSVISTGWTVYLDAFPASGVLEIPKPPAMSVSGITYLVDNVSTTVDPDTYRFVQHGAYGFGRIGLVAGEAWPTDADVGTQVQVAFTGGMADGTGAGVRAKHMGIHRGLALLAGDYFRHREDSFIDVRMVEIDRKIVNGVNKVAGRYRLLNRQA